MEDKTSEIQYESLLPTLETIKTSLQHVADVTIECTIVTNIPLSRTEFLAYTYTGALAIMGNPWNADDEDVKLTAKEDVSFIPYREVDAAEPKSITKRSEFIDT